MANHPDLIIPISAYMSSIPRAVEAHCAIRFLIVCGGFCVRMTARGIEPVIPFHCIGKIWKQSALPLSYARIALSDLVALEGLSLLSSVGNLLDMITSTNACMSSIPLVAKALGAILILIVHTDGARNRTRASIPLK